MTGALQRDWHTTNQRYLSAALASIRTALERHPDGTAREHRNAGGGAPTGRAPDSSNTPDYPVLEELRGAVPGRPALDELCAAFGLSPFERDLLLLCAGVELDSAFAALCAAAQGDVSRPYPTFSLALAALADPHWSALAPARPLRRWLLIDVDLHGPLTVSPLRIDERILHFLTGVQHLDQRLAGRVDPVPPSDDLVPSHRALAARAVEVWSGHPTGDLATIELCGPDPGARRAVAAAAASRLGMGILGMSIALVPDGPRERGMLAHLLEREAVLSGSALLLEEDDRGGDQRALARLIEGLGVPLFVSGRQQREPSRRPAVVIDVPLPSRSEQWELWHTSLTSAGVSPDGEVDGLVAQFAMTASAIRGACTSLGRAAAPDEAGARLDRIWDACRVQCRPRLDGLAQRLEAGAVWADLVLPDAQTQTLREITVHLRHRVRVYDDWGFAARSSRGLGISALFTGASGTGKTMAAEVLAHELRLDLYRIDLSQVVSKYVGETERNLRRVFDAADEGGAILLFDEADALFGKRTEVRDSHDRYANIEVSYLLQRMEAYRGLAILTTNMKEALDPAFLRRIRFIVQFPFPDEAHRAEIWRRAFPDQTPTAALDPHQLARLNVSGGTIRNIALRAAFLAAADGTHVTMNHLARAARGEFAKLERPLTDAQIGGW